MMKKSKFIYYHSLTIKKKNDNEYIFNNHGGISYNKQDCIDIMKNNVKFVIDDDPDCTYDNFLDLYKFEYIISVISRDHIEFDNYTEKSQYIKNNIKNLNKDNLYEFLVSISDIAGEYYDYLGNFMYGEINTTTAIDPIFISENDIGLTAPLFKEGDLVTRKNYPNELYIVISSLERNFRHEDFPIEYDGVVMIAPLKDYKTEDEAWENSIRYARSELKLFTRKSN